MNWVFQYAITWYDADADADADSETESLRFAEGLVSAEDFTDAVERLESYYGKEELVSIEYLEALDMNEVMPKCDIENVKWKKDANKF